MDSVENDQDRELVQRQRGDPARDPAPAGREHGRGGRLASSALHAGVPQRRLPPSVKLDILLDRSMSIRKSVHDVQFTLLLTAVLVVLVIFLFLRNVTATIIPALALPISIIGTFAGMYALGYSLDNVSLLALTLAVGFVVDDAIVMLENIVRHIENGEAPMQAALDGSREIGFTIVSITDVAGRGVHPDAVHGRRGRPRCSTNSP